MSFSARGRVGGWGDSRDPTGLRAQTGSRTYSVTVHSRVAFCRLLESVSVFGRVMMIRPSDAAVSGESVVISVTG